jgi:hypothetical protein
MARSSSLRGSKYSAKSVGDVIKNRFDAQKDSMVAQQQTAADTAFANEAADKEDVLTLGAKSIQIPFYLAFGRQCAKKVRTHGANAMTIAEMQDVGTLWKTRGLVSGCLIAVAANYGLTIVLA